MGGTRSRGRGVTWLTSGAIAGSGLLLLLAALAHRSPRSKPLAPEAPRAAPNAPAYARLPWSFETNAGQTDASVDFLAHIQGGTVFLAPTEATLLLGPASQQPPAAQYALRMRWVGAHAAPPVGAQPLPGVASYFLGADRSRWRTGLKTYARVRYAGLYPGIDLTYYGQGRELEYDVVLQPGADLSRVELAFEGADSLSVDGEGDLRVRLGERELIQHRPTVYQEDRGARIAVKASYAVDAHQRVTFRVEGYDPRRPLVVDPVLTFSELFSGQTGDGDATAVTADATGAAYVTGRTSSLAFPTTSGVVQPTATSDSAFLVKLDPSGSTLVYATYLGGTSSIWPTSVAVDSAGDAYVTGYTKSSDFPTTPGAFQPSYGGGSDDGFILVLNPLATQLLYASYLGGSGDDRAWGVSTGNGTNAYVVGTTNSKDFPTTDGGFQTVMPGSSAGFVTKVASDGTGLSYSTFLGGSVSGEVNGVAVDSTGSAYVVGLTQSLNFPTTPGAFEGDVDGGAAFVTKLDPTGATLAYSTLLGGSGDQPYGIAVDSQGDAYVAGTTSSSNFPTTPGAFQRGFDAGYYTTFLTLLNDAGTAPIYSTLLGEDTQVMGVGVDLSGNAYVAGFTQLQSVPGTAGALQPTFAGTSWNGFAAQINPTGTALGYWTYLYGNTVMQVHGIAVDGLGNTYFAGNCDSRGFPTTAGAFQAVTNGGTLGYVSKLNNSGTAFAYSSFLSGQMQSAFVSSVATDPAGNTYVSGNTQSNLFPTTSGVVQPSFAGGDTDVFVLMISDAGTVRYATYLGGSGAESAGRIAVDAEGQAYVVGETTSRDFPTTAGAAQPTNHGAWNAFVTKLAADGTGLQYSTYLGGSSQDVAIGVAVDDGGNAYVTGYAASLDFPVTPGALDGGGNSGFVFVTKVSPAGTSLVYSSTFGSPGAGYNVGEDVLLDALGNATVVGYTNGASFPTTPGALQPTFGGQIDGFVSRLNPQGTRLLYSTYLGGTGSDEAISAAQDGDGGLYVVGYTTSTNFPVTAGAWRGAFGGNSDGFLMHLASTGALAYSTYVGGDAGDYTAQVAVDGAGRVFVTGQTTSTDLPVTPDALQKSNAGLTDAFVLAFPADGAPPEYLSYLGGSAVDEGLGIALGFCGAASIIGFTNSADFPTTDGQAGSMSGEEAFVAQLDGFRPALRSVSPGSGTTLGGTSVALTGAALRPGATVTFGDAGASAVTWVSCNTFSASSPPHAAGAVDVTLTNPGALSSTLVGGFTYVAAPGDGGLGIDGGPGTDGGVADAGAPDAGPSPQHDAGVDAGPQLVDNGGCGCTGAPGANPLLCLLSVLLASRASRRRP
jgi:hypothetical protein